MYQALYREYRPEVFEDVVGQDTIVKILKSQISMDRVGHAYLFCGTRGTGKTTTARLLAKAVNCLDHEHRPCGVCKNCKSIQSGSFMDLIEIDAASNNGVNDIRELRESVLFPPAVGRKKVYIIDEVHALSKEAFNAFLKTLEEPPENVIFILATTEPQKLPQTILSRCLRMDFRRVCEREITKRMEEICRNRGVDIDESTLALVAANADGSLRDGLTLLDQCISGRSGKITREEVLDAIGAVGEDVYIELVNKILAHKTSDALLELHRALEGGRDARQLVIGLLNHYRNLLLIKYIESPENALNMSFENAERLRKQSDMLELADIDEAIMELAQMSRHMQSSSQPRILLEVTLVRLASSESADTVQRKVREKIYKKPENISLERDMASTNTEERVKEGENNSKNSDENDFQEKNENIDEIWNKAVSKMANEKPSINLIRNCIPLHIKNAELSILPDSQSAKLMLSSEKRHIQDAIKEVAGRDLALRIADEERENTTDHRRAKEAFKNISGGFELKIE